MTENSTDIILIQSLDDWAKIDTAELRVARGDGRINLFRVYSVDAKTKREIGHKYNSIKPVKPIPPRVKPGAKPDHQSPFYLQELKDYELAEDKATRMIKYWTLEAGFLKPNNIDIPGKTDDDKMGILEEKIPAGDIDQLYVRIADISNLRGQDIGFF